MTSEKLKGLRLNNPQTSIVVQGAYMKLLKDMGLTTAEIDAIADVQKLGQSEGLTKAPEETYIYI